MAKAHEMAASTRRGFHTALEAVLSRSRDEAPDDELRSLLPSPPKAPVQAPRVSWLFTRPPSLPFSLLVILRGTNSLGASGWGQGKGLWVLQHGGHDIFQKVVVDGDVVERLLGVCGDVGRVKGVAGRLCFQPEGAGVFRRPCRRQKLCPSGRGSIAPSSWWCRNRDEEGQVVGQGMLNENGRLGGLVKSQETLLGRGIAQQLVLEEGILGALFPDPSRTPPSYWSPAG